MSVGEGAALAAAALAFLAGAHAARTGKVGALERRVFRAVNGLPQSLHVPVWCVMQLGSLAGVIGAGGAAMAFGHRTLAWRLAASGTVTWGAAKVVKRFVRRGRPNATLDVTRILGRAQSGLGYPSGHAAVAATLAVVALSEVDPALRPAVLAGALAVGPSRVYVGAHLPLDVVGGIAFGVAIGLLTRV